MATPNNRILSQSERKAAVIAERQGVVLRHAEEPELAHVAEMAVSCFQPIHDYYQGGANSTR